MKNHPTFHLGNDHTDYYEQASYTWSEDSIRFLNTDQFLLIAFVGLITGVGGGMFRDVLAGIMPAVLRKHVYACASLVGAICYLGLLCVMPRGYAMFAGAVIVVVIRLLASHYKWNIPRVM